MLLKPVQSDFPLRDELEITVEIRDGVPHVATVIDVKKTEYLPGVVFQWESPTHKGYLAKDFNGVWVNAGGWQKDDVPTSPDPEMTRRVYAVNPYVCYACGKDHEDFSLNNDVWGAVWPNEWHEVARISLSTGATEITARGTLCIPCVEKRLRRNLVAGDYDPAYPRSLP